MSEQSGDDGIPEGLLKILNNLMGAAGEEAQAAGQIKEPLVEDMPFQTESLFKSAKEHALAARERVRKLGTAAGSGLIEAVEFIADEYEKHSKGIPVRCVARLMETYDELIPVLKKCTLVLPDVHQDEMTLILDHVIMSDSIFRICLDYRRREMKAKEAKDSLWVPPPPKDAGQTTP